MAGTSTFYRWVSMAELEDIQETGQLRQNPDGSGYSTGKLVTDSPELAVEWGKKVFDEYPDKGTVIEIVVEVDEDEDIEPFDDNLDQIGPGYLLDFDMLQGADIHEYE